MLDSKYDKLYMDIADLISLKSKSLKRKVGAIAVKDDNIIAMGFNGTPNKWFHNDCEDYDTMETLEEVIHAEANMVAKIARSNNSSTDCTVYTTTAPCVHCAKLLHQSGVKRVVYKHSYKNDMGLVMLSMLDIEVHKLT